MFTGLIRHLGTLAAVDKQAGGLLLTVDAALSGVKIGDSIAIDGCCLTAVTLTPLTFFVADESLRRTKLSGAKQGDQVHVEQAMLASDRLDGHVVQGHVDAVAVLASTRSDGDALWLTYKVAPEWTRYMIDKGSIAIDGVSLTLTEVGETSFAVMIIPHTQTHTHLSRATIGQRVNIECDVLGKYVAKQLAPYEEKWRAH